MQHLLPAAVSQMLRPRHMQTIPLDPRRLDAVTILHPSPPLRHRITSMAASPDGHHLLLMGTEVRRGAWG